MTAKFVPYCLLTSYLSVKFKINQQLLIIPKTMIRLCKIIGTAYLLHFSAFIYAQETESETDNAQASETVEQVNQPKYSANLNALEQESSANESFWLDINEHKTLVLKHWARGKVLRGDLILLHAQSENADHSRLIKPLAKHFSHRGWHVYIPNLPIEDYPELKQVNLDMSANLASNDQATVENRNEQNATDETTPTEESNETNEQIPSKPDYFFETEESYQQFITQLINNLSSNIQPKSENLLVIANQNSGFWVLESTKTNSNFDQLALLQPQLPLNIESNLENHFNGQTLPVFAFFEDIESESVYLDAFVRQLWRSPFQRINRGTFSNRGIEEENPQIAKLIIGWVTRIKKQK